MSSHGPILVILAETLLRN